MLFLLLACTSPTPTSADPSPLEALLAEMTLEEKVFEMHGRAFEPRDGLYQAGGSERLGIPMFAMSDGPRGVTAGTSTTFPVGMARGASFDPELERSIAAAMALELRAKGGNVLLAPVVETLRHPAWGRAQETYGEDPHHIGVMGAAFVEGAQEAGVIATPKHFAVNSIEDTRFDVDVTIDARSLQELYLPPHAAAIDAGAHAVMAAYNAVNGEFAAENRTLLTDILRDQLGFEGLVMSDWIFGTHDTLGMIDAGLDLEMPAAKHYGQPLLDAVDAGEVDESDIDAAVARILTVKLEALDEAPVDLSVVESPAHVELALQSALASMVLLKNEGALPLDDVSTLAVLGRLADAENLGDEGSSNARPSQVVTPLQGLSEAAGPGVDVLQVTATTEAAAADAAVLVVGLTAEDEGENLLLSGGDRSQLGLSAEDQHLIEAVAAVQPRTIVVLIGGSAIRVDPWESEVEGLVMAWYPGMEGGRALGQLLFGQAEFSGRLPLSFPVEDADLPPFDHTSEAVTYDYWHGYRHLDHQGTAPRFAFGHGLSYTTFAYQGLDVQADANGLIAEVTLRNTGSRRGAEVVQLYLGTTAIPDRAPRDLRAFEKVWLDPGETTTVTLSVPARGWQHWDGGWRTTPAQWVVEVGPNHTQLPLQQTVMLP